MAGLDLGDISAYERMLYGNVEDDPDLEAELLAIQDEIGEDDDDDASASRGASSSSKPQRTVAVRPHAATGRPNAMADIDRLARQISQEINVEDDENDESVDDDPELLAELSAVVSVNDSVSPSLTAGVPSAKVQQRSSPASDENIGNRQRTGDSTRDSIVLIEDRLTNYKAAQKAAKEAGDAAKLRRLDRGIATLQEQLSHARAGKPVARSDVPPPVTVVSADKKISPSSSTPSLPQVAPKPQMAPPQLPLPVYESHSATNAMTEEKRSSPIKAASPEKKEDATRTVLHQRRDEFRKAAVEAKQNGHKEAALEYLKTCKQFDKVIEAYENGQEVDLTGMPTVISTRKVPAVTPPATATSSELPRAVAETDESAFGEKATAAAFKAPPPPSTVSEALQQRLEKYKSAAEQAQQENNSSKARRMGRIQKQYEDAIKAHRAGKPIDFEALPTPPGFAPIPIGGGVAASSRPQATSDAITAKTQVQARSVPGAQPAAGQRRPSPAAGGPASSAPPAKMSKQEQELKFLLDRQKQFKVAALAAKKRGDLNVAKHLLKQALGFDQMIEACKNGLRIDIASTPTPPQMKTAAGVTKPAISAAAMQTVATELALKKEGDVLAKAGYEDVFSTLEQDLIHQIQVCDRNREFFLNTGDVARVSEFERVANAAKKDLAALRNCFKHGDPPPRFHYETRVFPSIKCFPELGTDDLELSVVRGLQLRLPSGYEPKDADIHVKYELGYPKETPQTGRTGKVKGTNSPAFEFTTTLRINPKSRQFLHMLKRIGVKFEIMQKGGFLRSDICLGTAEVKLASLESQPLIHQCVDVIENRKPVGGKLEIKIRVREPLVQKQAEEVKEKWLVVDQFTVAVKPSALAANRAAAAAAFGNRQLGLGK